MKNSTNFIKTVLGVFLLTSVVFPLINMISSLSVDTFQQILSQQAFKNALLNSIIYSTFATIVSVTLAIIIALCLMRTNVRGKQVFVLLFSVPILIPSISHGLGLILLFGANGVLTKALNLSWNIYGSVGIVFGSVLYSFPIAFLMLVDALKYEDGSVYEAAKVLGIPKIKQFINITLPYLKKTLISVVFTVFAVIVTDYGVPLIIGGKTITLPVLMYQEVIGLLDFKKGIAISSFLLIPALIAFAVDVLIKNRSKNSFVTKSITLSSNITRDTLSYILLTLVLIVIIMPIVAFSFMAFIAKYPTDLTYTFVNFAKTLSSGYKYLMNSLIIATISAFVGVCVSFATAYLTARSEYKQNTMWLHFIALSSLAIPGIVLGLAYLIFFSGTILQGTLLILVAVNIIHFFGTPYLMMYNSLSKINQNIEAVGLTLGIGKLRMIKDVFLPVSKQTLLEMFAYYFTNAIMTISAVAFLATVDNKPIALMIPQFEGQVQIEYAAVVSVIILLVNVILKGVIYTMVINKKNVLIKDNVMTISKREFDILVALEQADKEMSQRSLSNKTNISLGTVNKTLKQLEEAKLVADGKITKKGLVALAPYKVKRAIFLAAGFGSRLVPVTLNTPKPLVRINGKRIIDTMLDAVIDAEIDEIVIVRGYLAEQFDQLKYKYPKIRFIDNPIYNETNNISSAMCVRYMMSNAYVLEADLFLKNPALITKYQYASNYLGVPVEKTDDWCFSVEGKNIKGIGVGGRNCFLMYGVSYWTEQDGNKLANHIEEVYNSPGGKEKFWDKVHLEVCAKDYNVSIRECLQKDIVEIDTFRELKSLDPIYGE